MSGLRSAVTVGARRTRVPRHQPCTRLVRASRACETPSCPGRAWARAVRSTPTRPGALTRSAIAAVPSAMRRTTRTLQGLIPGPLDGDPVVFVIDHPVRGPGERLELLDEHPQVRGVPDVGIRADPVPCRAVHQVRLGAMDHPFAADRTAHDLIAHPNHLLPGGRSPTRAGDGPVWDPRASGTRNGPTTRAHATPRADRAPAT